jgi:hypothetical protein
MIQVDVLWVVTPYRVAVGCRCFRVKMKPAWTFGTLIIRYHSITLRHNPEDLELNLRHQNWQQKNYKFWGKGVEGANMKPEGVRGG